MKHNLRSMFNKEQYEIIQLEKYYRAANESDRKILQ